VCLPRTNLVVDLLSQCVHQGKIGLPICSLSVCTKEKSGCQSAPSACSQGQIRLLIGSACTPRKNQVVDPLSQRVHQGQIGLPIRRLPIRSLSVYTKEKSVCRSALSTCSPRTNWVADRRSHLVYQGKIGLSIGSLSLYTKAKSDSQSAF
jgi:hypothetical protein